MHIGCLRCSRISSTPHWRCDSMFQGFQHVCINNQQPPWRLAPGLHWILFVDFSSTCDTLIPGLLQTEPLRSSALISVSGSRPIGIASSSPWIPTPRPPVTSQSTPPTVWTLLGTSVVSALNGGRCCPDRWAGGRAIYLDRYINRQIDRYLEAIDQVVSC